MRLWGVFYGVYLLATQTEVSQLRFVFIFLIPLERHIQYEIFRISSFIIHPITRHGAHISGC